MANVSSSPTLATCTFSQNSASYGGGMHNDSSSPTLTNSIFFGNSAVYGHGGGMYNDESSPALSNCTFAGNSADDTADGMLNLSSSPTLTNCILWNSDAEDSENEVINSSDATPIFSYCDIRGSFNEGVWNERFGTDEGNNIDHDPLFVRNPGTNGEDDPGDLHLTAESPCIDAGDPSITDGQDMDGEVRVFDGNEDGTAIIDIGADEFVVSNNDGDGSDGGNGGSKGSGSSGGCFINTLFGAVE